MDEISGQSLYEERGERQVVESAGVAPAEPATTETPTPTDTVAEQVAEDNVPASDAPTEEAQPQASASKATEPVPHSAGNQPIERPAKYHDFICDGHKTHNIYDSKDNKSPQKRADVENEMWKMEDEAAANKKQSQIVAEGYSASPRDQELLQEDLKTLRKMGLVTPKAEKDESFEQNP